MNDRLRLHLTPPFVALVLVLAVTASQAELPPPARQALQKGIIAAKLPDYLLALRFFEEARKAAPEAPVVYLNMGLAESRLPGRELRAIAWFGAYLAAYPSAANAAAVREQMELLDVRSQSQISRVITLVQDASASSKEPAHARISVVGLWAGIGDIAAAIKVANLIEGVVYQGYARKRIARALAERGNFAEAQRMAASIQLPKRKLPKWKRRKIARIQVEGGEPALSKPVEKPRPPSPMDLVNAHLAARDMASALKAAELIQDAAKRDGVLLQIAGVQLETGDLTGARKTAALVQPVFAKCTTQIAVAAAMNKAGDGAGARSVLASARQCGELIVDTHLKGLGLAWIAGAQARSGDLAGARETLVSAQRATELIVEAAARSGAYVAIGAARFESGDAAGAREALAAAQRAAEVPTKLTYQQVRAHARIAQAQRKGGDLAASEKSFASALKIIEQMPTHEHRDGEYFFLAQLQASSGDIAGAHRSARLVHVPLWRARTLKYVAVAQAKAGDAAAARSTFVEAKRTAELIQDSDSRGDAQADIAEAQARSGDVPGAKKTAELIQDASPRSSAHSRIAVLQARSGDVGGARASFVEAQKAADLIQNPGYRDNAEARISMARATAGIPAAPEDVRRAPSTDQPTGAPAVFASDWLRRLDDTRKSEDCPLNTDPFLDLSGYLKSMPALDDPQGIFERLRDVARALVKAQAVVQNMVKRQFLK